MAFLGLDAVHIYGRAEVLLLQLCCSGVHQRSESQWLLQAIERDPLESLLVDLELRDILIGFGFNR